jgi:hypothetical protein
VLHNHPSGDPTPSQADIQMTKAIVAIALSLGISVHDHIIVGKNGQASLKGDEADLSPGQAAPCCKPHLMSVIGAGAEVIFPAGHFSL